MTKSPPIDGRPKLGKSKLIIVKVGSALLAHGGARYFSKLARQLKALHDSRRNVVLVSSGAIAFGFSVLGYAKRPRRLGPLQASAAAGQPELVRRWAHALGRHDIPTAQVLLTHADLANRRRFLNARHAIEELLRKGVIPIANENDTVATDEIRVGDNDQLSAHLANLVRADLLILLTTVDGLYTANPEKDHDAKRISIVTRPREVSQYAGTAGDSGLGVGGMHTKIEAAHTAVASGIPVVIAHGAHSNIIARVLAGDDVGTLFLPGPGEQDRLRSRKHWIGFTAKPLGTLHIDAGAAKALTAGAGKSLLPSGVARVEGQFERGDTVVIEGPDGVIARGLAGYSGDEMRRLQGRKSNEIERILGYVDTPCVVHWNDMALSD